MGLDQYAWSQEHPITPYEGEDGVLTMDCHDRATYEWRKHSQLQEFMTTIFDTNGGVMEDRDFNVNPIRLERRHVRKLFNTLVDETLPRSQGGLFFGHQFQDEQSEHYRMQDREFVDWAFAELDNGWIVYYDCWW